MERKADTGRENGAGLPEQKEAGLSGKKQAAPPIEEQEQMSLEEAFGILEQTIKRLEDETISLEESFRIYQSGMELLRYCNKSIDEVEQKIMVINEKGELDEF